MWSEFFSGTGNFRFRWWHSSRQTEQKKKNLRRHNFQRSNLVWGQLDPEAVTVQEAEKEEKMITSCISKEKALKSNYHPLELFLDTSGLCLNPVLEENVIDDRRITFKRWQFYFKSDSKLISSRKHAQSDFILRGGLIYLFVYIRYDASVAASPRFYLEIGISAKTQKWFSTCCLKKIAS